MVTSQINLSIVAAQINLNLPMVGSQISSTRSTTTCSPVGSPRRTLMFQGRKVLRSGFQLFFSLFLIFLLFFFLYFFIFHILSIRKGAAAPTKGSNIMSTICAQVIFMVLFIGIFCLIDGRLGKLPISIILSKIEVVPLQNDVTLTTAFEGEDIPSFGVFTDHQVALIPE